MNWEERLAKSKEEFRASRREVSGDKFPGGECLLQLMSASLGEYKEKVFVQRQFIITEGEYKSTSIGDRIYFESASYPREILIKWLDTSLTPIDDIMELPEALEKVTETQPIYQSFVTLNGQFYNVDTLELLSEGGGKEDEKKPAEKIESKVIDGENASDDTMFEEVRRIYAEQGIDDFEDAKTLEELIRIGDDYEFYTPNCCPEDEEPISKEDAKLLLDAGFMGNVHQRKKKTKAN